MLTMSSDSNAADGTVAECVHDNTDKGWAEVVTSLSSEWLYDSIAGSGSH